MRFIMTLMFAAAITGSAAAQQYTAEQLLKAWDKDDDGALSKAEWLGAGRREQGFDFGDRNKDGKLTLEELKAAMAAAQSRQGG